MNNKTLFQKILIIIPYIYNHGGSVSENELKEFFGLNRSMLRKIYDMTLLLGYPPYTPETFFDLYIDEKNPGKVNLWIPHANLLTSPVSFTVKEAFALLSGYKLIARTFENEILIDLMTKIHSSLQNSFNKDFVDPTQKIDFASQSPESIEKNLVAIDSATKNCHSIKMEYYSASIDNISIRRIDPYLTINHFGNWYVVGRCHDRKDYRVFRFDRIKIFSIEDEYFIPRKDFDANKYLNAENFYFTENESLEKIVLRFRKKVANRIKQEFFDAELQNLPSGDVIAKLPLRNSAWLLSRIRKFGSDVIVESPEDFKQKTISSYEKLLKIYNS